jgi:polysaccharide biosynthesis/export protein
MQWRKLLVAAALAVVLVGCTRYPPELYGFSFDDKYTLDSGDEVRVKTVEQVQRIIASRLKARFIKDPKVAVQVVAYRPVFVLGEVRNAGQFAFVNGLTVESAVAIAGGYTERALLSEARVVRVGTNGERIVSYVPGGFPVRPGDTIYVPERWF